jgi:hypothetical protein
MASIARDTGNWRFLARKGKFSKGLGDTVCSGTAKEATMYHPDAMLKIAYDREAELVREAVACGVPKGAEADSVSLSKRVLSIALTVTTLIVVLARRFGQQT